MVVMLKQCCCGCTLKTGTLIIAVVFAILAALQVVVFSVGAVETSERYQILRMQAEIEEEERLSGTPMPLEDDDHHAGNYTSHDRDAPVALWIRVHIIHIWKWCTIFLSIAGTVDFVLNVLLMFAANKDSARHVLVWVVGFFVVSCSRLLLMVVMVGSVFAAGAVVGPIILLSISVVFSVGAAYSGLVVYSYYRQLVGMGVARRISQQDE